MDLKTRRILIRLKIHAPVLSFLAAAAFAGMAAGSLSVAGPFALLFFIYGLTMPKNPLPRIWEERTIQDAKCSACGLEGINLTDTWSCSCGFVTYEPRHVFSPCPNPNCRKVCSWIVCSQCGASIEF